MAKGKTKNKKQAFWKRVGPEVDRLTRHVGKIFDNSNVSDIVNLGIYGGLALQGAAVIQDIRGALIGPVGLKLAMSRNIISGAAGLAILAGLGIASIAGSVSGPRKENGQTVIEVTDADGSKQTYPIHCEWVGPLGSKEQCRCWYPGLGWRYVDKSFCEP